MLLLEDALDDRLGIAVLHRVDDVAVVVVVVVGVVVVVDVIGGGERGRARRVGRDAR